MGRCYYCGLYMVGSWRICRDDILIMLDEIYHDIFDKKDDRDHQLITDAYHTGWDKYYICDTPLSIASGVKIFDLVKIMLNRIRKVRYFVSRGGWDEKRQFTDVTWPYQKALCGKFDKLVEHLGERSFQQLTKKGRDGQEYEIKINMEPIVENMIKVTRVIKSKYMAEYEKYEEKEEKKEEKKEPKKKELKKRVKKPKKKVN